MLAPLPLERSPSVGEFYRFTLGLGLRALVTNLELFRTVEYTWLLRAVGTVAGKRVLDYACWTSYLPAYFAAKGAGVIALDFPAGIREQERRRSRRGPTAGAWLNVAGGASTARDLPLATGSVGLAYAISSLDHLPGERDAQCLQELLRVTEPGGTVFVSVPYGKRYTEGTFGGWLQKRYDWAAVREKFLDPSAGVETALSFFGDARTRRWTGLYWKLPRVARIATRRLQFPAARRLLRDDRAHIDDATLIGIRLTKPGAVR